MVDRDLENYTMSEIISNFLLSAVAEEKYYMYVDIFKEMDIFNKSNIPVEDFNIDLYENKILEIINSCVEEADVVPTMDLLTVNFIRSKLNEAGIELSIDAEIVNVRYCYELLRLINNLENIDPNLGYNEMIASVLEEDGVSEQDFILDYSRMLLTIGASSLNTMEVFEGIESISIFYTKRILKKICSGLKDLEAEDKEEYNIFLDMLSIGYDITKTSTLLTNKMLRMLNSTSIIGEDIDNVIAKFSHFINPEYQLETYIKLFAIGTIACTNELHGRPIPRSNKFLYSLNSVEEIMALVNEYKFIDLIEPDPETNDLVQIAKFKAIRNNIAKSIAETILNLRIGS